MRQDKLPALIYLRCDGSKYNAKLSSWQKFAGRELIAIVKFINDEIIGSISDEEFVVPDLGSKIPRLYIGGDAGAFIIS